MIPLSSQSYGAAIPPELPHHKESPIWNFYHSIQRIRFWDNSRFFRFKSSSLVMAAAAMPWAPGNMPQLDSLGRPWRYITGVLVIRPLA